MRADAPEIEISAVDLESWTASGSALATLESSLDERERAVADRRARPALRDRYVAAHAAARVVVGERLGIAPTSVRIERSPCLRCGGPHGRPRISGGGRLEFSLSHSARRALVGLRDGGPVGIDVEERRALRNPRALVEHVADAGEAAAIRSLAGDAVDVALSVWVRKEAVVKATGEGLAAARRYPVGVGSLPGWYVSMVELDGEHVAAVAAPRRPSAVDAGGRYDLRWLRPPWE